VIDEITHELIKNIVKDTVKETLNEFVVVSNSEDGWFQALGIMTTIGVSVVALLISLKQHNEKQEKIRNLELVKQLEHYDAELNNVIKKFDAFTDVKFYHCFSLASDFLTILNRLSYLRKRDSLDDKTMLFFKNNFNSGRYYLSWLEFMLPNNCWDDIFAYFYEIKDNFNYPETKPPLRNAFYYFIHKRQKDSNYDPYTDQGNQKTYTPEDEDYTF